MYKHFDKISANYYENIGDKQDIYLQIKNILNQYIEKKILLDIGSGGNIFYSYELPKKIILLDISSEMLKKNNNKKVITVEQDARNMSKIVDNSIDIIIIAFALHHINGKNYKEAICSLNKVLLEANKKLKLNGEIFIIEPVLNNLFYFCEILLFHFTYFILKKFKIDMVFFYNKKIITKNLLNIFSKSDIKILNLKMKGWFDPLLGTFPGKIKIPSFLMPTSMKVFYLKKN